MEEARIARLSILDSYGVRWTHDTFARDLLQNFFDSASDFRAVGLDVHDPRGEEGSTGSGVVEIRGPETFDVDLLAYIGATTKTSGRTVGGFGEGFKICALIGARDFGLTITAGSGAHEIEVFFDPVPLGRELCYRVVTRQGEPAAGSYVRLEGCDAACLAAFRAAPAMFRHPHNPKLQEPIVVDEAQGVGVYAADGRDGELYYRRQLRGRARFYTSRGGGPVSLAHDGIVDELEGDRDRRDLRAQPLAHAVGQKLAPADLHRVILHLMPYWKYGTEVLAGLLSAAAARGLRFEWPARWLARSANERGLVEFAERQGFNIALAAFAELGMPTPENHYTNLETRDASPMERARFAVVADLYAELNGKPARPTKLEVFDVAGAAVAGQHLGDRIVVGAELFDRGFDGVAGTILHELAHETGGEEDLRFLRRLTTLIGATVRAPDAIRAARRRYASAVPVEEAPAEAQAAGPPPAYTPEVDHHEEDLRGVIITVVVPPAFPPTEALLATIRAAAAETGVGVWVCCVTVTGPVGAVSWCAPGLPTVFVGSSDVEPPAPDRAALGYHLRTYGPEGMRLCPDPAAIAAAIRRAKEQGLTGPRALALHRGLRQGRRERVRALLGVEIPEPREQESSRREQRDELVRAYLAHLLGHDSGFTLDDALLHGRHAAAEQEIRRARKDRRVASSLFAAIAGRIRTATEYAEALRDGDPDFDDADAFERSAMNAAMGAAISSFALETDEAAARARAEAAFRAVRAGTTRVLDLDVALEAKIPALEHAVFAAGLGYAWQRRTHTFDLAVFNRELDRAEAEAMRLQRVIDEEGGYMHGSMLKTTLDKLAEAPEVTRRIADNARIIEDLRRTSLSIRAAYDGALAESGSAIAAANRCMEEAARLRPETLQ